MARTADVDAVRFGGAARERSRRRHYSSTDACDQPAISAYDRVPAFQGENSKNDLRLATHWQDPKLIERLIAAGGDVNATPEPISSRLSSMPLPIRRASQL